MKVSPKILLAILTLLVAGAWAESKERSPHLGYLYPAGGQQGTVVEITAGGQFLRGVNRVYVSGEGVRASVIQYYRPVRFLAQDRVQALRSRLQELWKKRLAELPLELQKSMPLRNDVLPDGLADPGPTPMSEVDLPEHPLLRGLDNMSLRQLAHVRHELLKFRKKQPNPQLEETVLIAVTVEPTATPGDRELRLLTPAGLTNPMRFQVGLLPEVSELEPNGPVAFAPGPKGPPPDAALASPVVINGQIMPGDVDRFRFQARRGQDIVVETQARRLVPYLADAVPGWFQATLALYDGPGREIAFDDDYRFDPDPVVFYEIPEDGEYSLEIRDSIYRGRDDFVYRVAVGELPFITELYPLGAHAGEKTTASVAGWNLPARQLLLDTEPWADRIRWAELRGEACLSNSVPYAIDTLPECDETEPNDTVREAQGVTLPLTVNGRIAAPDDVDVFRFEGHVGEQIVAEVSARRLQSPLDSLLRLTDASGRVLEWNDDQEDKESGLLTHHADSYLRAQLPETGSYYVHLADVQQHGGSAYSYRLTIAPPRPDFALRVTPSSINVPAGRAAPICVYALRKDGFEGEIEITLKDAPPGFALNGGRIPSGCERVRMTLTAPSQPLPQPVFLQLEGRVWLNGKWVTHPVAPADDMMQAFLYRHLVPAQELMVAVTGPLFRGRPIQLAGNYPVRISEGGTAEVRVRAPRSPMLAQVKLELDEPPKGLTLEGVQVAPEGLSFLLKADAGAAQSGLAGNLIVEAFVEKPNAPPDGKPSNQNRRVSLGVLPAIPFEVVKQ
ncbi:MAG: hypothetical protein HY706_08140 [Candidatus Hydrogenedentes bacterium]|nr:hypothetical protein [Candidatus Hydrogenedentota bacterium]